MCIWVSVSLLSTGEGSERLEHASEAEKPEFYSHGDCAHVPEHKNLIDGVSGYRLGSAQPSGDMRLENVYIP